MASLTVTSGPDEGKRIEVERELVLGREHADVELDDPEISRRHARVRAVADGVEVEDLGSSNGTKVDGERISGTVLLKDGDSFKLGQTVLRVEARSSATVLSDVPGGAAPQATAAPRATVVGGPVGSAWREDSGDTERGRPVQTPKPAPAAPRGEFGTLRKPPARRRRGVASRLLLPSLLTYLAIAGTAAGLIYYFAERT